MIDPQQIDSKFTHQLEVALELRWRPKIMPFGIRPEWPVGHAFDKKLPISFKEEFGNGADARWCTHWRYPMEAKAPRPDWLMGDLMLRVTECQGMAPVGTKWTRIRGM